MDKGQNYAVGDTLTITAAGGGSGRTVTITDVEVSGDLQHCKIFVSIFGEENTKNQDMSGLNAATGFLRGELGRNLKLRRAPDINFQLDQGIEKGTSLLNLLDKLGDQRQSNSETN